MTDPGISPPVLVAGGNQVSLLEAARILNEKPGETVFVVTRNTGEAEICPRYKASAPWISWGANLGNAAEAREIAAMLVLAAEVVELADLLHAEQNVGAGQ